MLGTILNALGGLVLKPVLSYLQQKSSAARDVRLAEIGSEKDQAIALVQAEIEANKLRADAGSRHSWLMSLIALPYVLHSGAVMLDTTFRFGWGVPVAPGKFAEYEGQILLSFFVVSAASALIRSMRK
ncbi:hypothetical protein [uncultured Methylobacterium sp.]|jgi:hypothetical protein|uniref:hypothetical protein n=1 Tax=uncultured Methylobacterium sp. TaxID=157278 RepID=UPI00260C1274|nr:hypothetical protein [uncultured Methylobacterium sp.]